MSGDLATWQTTNVSFYGTGGPCAVHVHTAALPDQPPPSQPSSLPRTLCHFFWITTFVDASGKAVIGTRDADGNVWQVQVAANLKGIEEDFLGSFSLGPEGLNKVVNSVVHPVVLMGNITDWRGTDPYQPVVPLSTVPVETQQWIQTIVSRAAEIRAQRNARAAAVASAPLTENPPGPKMYFRVVRSQVDSDLDTLWDDEEWAQGTNAFLTDSNYDGITDAQAAGKGGTADSDGDGLVDDEDAVPTDPLLMFPRVPESRYALMDLGPGTAHSVNASGQVLRAWEPGVPGSPKQVVVTALPGSTTANTPVPDASEIVALVGLSDDGKAFYLRRTEVAIPDYGNAGQPAQQSIHNRLWGSLNGTASSITPAGTPFPPPSFGPWTTTRLSAAGPVTAAGSVFNGIQNGEARATYLGQLLNSGVDLGSNYDGSPIWWNPGGIPMIEGIFWNYRIQATPESPVVAGNHPTIQPNSQQSVYATWPAVSREGDAVREEHYDAFPVPTPVGPRPRRCFFYHGLDGPQLSHEPIGNFEGSALAVASIPTLAGRSMGPLVIRRFENEARVYVRTPSGWQSTRLPEGDGNQAMPLSGNLENPPVTLSRYAVTANARGEFLYGETLWRNGRAHDLNQLIHLPLNPDGSPTSFRASDMNSSGLVCGTHLTANGPRAALLLPVDLDWDSDNNNGLALPEDSFREERSDDWPDSVIPEPLQAGKLLLVNDGDGDADGIPDFADNLTTTPSFGRPFSGLPQPPSSHPGERAPDGGRLVPVRLRLPEVLHSLTHPLTLKFSYEASNPSQVESGVTTGNRDDVIDGWKPAPGRARLWRKDGTSLRNPAAVAVDGDFIPSETEITLQQLPPMDSSGQRTIFVEAVRPDTQLGGLKLSLTLLKAGHPFALMRLRGTAVSAGLASPAPDNTPVRTNRLELAQPSPDVEITQLQVGQITTDASGTALYADVTVSGRVRSDVTDFSSHSDFEYLHMTLNGQPLQFADGAAIGPFSLAVPTAPASPHATLWKPYERVATFQQILTGLKLSEGQNILQCAVPGHRFGYTGFCERLISVQASLNGADPPAYAASGHSSTVGGSNLRRSDGGQPKLYVWQFRGPTALLERLSLKHHEELSGGWKGLLKPRVPGGQVFDVASEDDEKVAQVFLALPRRGAPYVPQEWWWQEDKPLLSYGMGALDFSAGFADGFWEGGSELVGGTLSLLGGVGTYGWYVVTVGGRDGGLYEFVIGKPLQQTVSSQNKRVKDTIKGLWHIASKLSALHYKLQTASADIVMTLAIGEEGEDLDEETQQLLMLSAELLEHAKTEWNNLNLTWNRKGHLTGRLIFELAAIIVPMTKAAQAGQLSKVAVMDEVATGLAARSAVVPEFASLAAKAANVANEYRALTLTGELCFVPGTPVLTFHGLRAIESVREDDLVWSRDPVTGEQGWQRVVQLFRTFPTALHHLTYVVVNSTGPPALSATRPRGPPASAGLVILTGTGTHPFWSITRQAFVPMSDLQVGDRLALAHGGEAIVASRTVETAPPGNTFTTHNFEVAQWHTYFAGEQPVWVHNLGSFCAAFTTAYKQAVKALNIPLASLAGRRTEVLLWVKQRFAAGSVPMSIDDLAHAASRISAKELDEVAKGSAATSTLRDCDWWFSTLFGNISQGGRHVHHIVPRYIQKYLRELPNGQLRPGWSLNENLSPGAVLERAEHLNDLHNGQNGMRTVLPSGSNQLNGRSANDVAQTLVNFYIDTGRKGMARAAQDFFAQRNIATDPIP